MGENDRRGAPSGSLGGAPDDAPDREAEEAPEPSSSLPAENGAGEGEYAPAVSSRRLEVLIALIALGASVLVVYLAGDIEVRRQSQAVGPRSWPRLLGLGGIALSLALLLCVLLRRPFARDDLESLTRLGLVRSVIAGALSVVFVLAWPLAGFVVAAIPFLVLTTFLFGGRGWRTLAIFPVGITAFIYLLFQIVLKVPL